MILLVNINFLSLLYLHKNYSKICNIIVSVASVADRLEIISYINVKSRRVLKGHQAKVLCSDWSPDKRHIVSSSQVRKHLKAFI